MRDHIRISTVCLFLCTLVYTGMAWTFYNRGEAASIVGIALGIYALVLYLIMSVLAIDLKKWAWHATNSALVVHILTGVAIAILAFQQGRSGFLYVGLWCAVGAIGLWANLRPGSRAALTEQV